MGCRAIGLSLQKHLPCDTSLRGVVGSYKCGIFYASALRTTRDKKRDIATPLLPYAMTGQVCFNSILTRFNSHLIRLKMN